MGLVPSWEQQVIKLSYKLDLQLKQQNKKTHPKEH
jgi:hypothetical protein